MINNLTVGPPQGFPGPQLRETAKAPRDDKPDSFTRTLQDRIDPKAAGEPKASKVEAKVKEAESSPPEKTPPKAEAPPGHKQIGARDKAIQKFMDSFESEFGIPATEIVEAMAQLNPEQMNQSASETAVDVVENLDIPEEDRDRALALYAGLLVDLKAADQKPVTPEFISNQNAAAAPLLKERVQLANEKKTVMNQGIERLNQKFWMKDAENSRMAGDQQTLGRQVQAKALERSEVFDDAVMDDQLMEEIPNQRIENPSDISLQRPEGGPLPMETAPATTATPAEQQSNQDLQQLIRDMKRAANDAAEKSQRSGEDKATWSGAEGVAAMKAPEAAAPLKAKNVVTAENVSQVSMPKFSAQEQMQGFGKESSSGQSGEGGRGAARAKSMSAGGEAKALTAASAQAAPVPLKMEDVAAALKASPAVNPMVVSPGEQETNIRQVLNQAQYLIKKGGGEVKVQMSPEGLGNLQLKVLVKDGKVNVQMAAESNEAKKAIESSLPDLKTSLAAHKLSVDHIKVDVVSGPSTDTQARNDTMNSDSQAREGTKQFWNQFQESFGNRAQKDGMWDIPSLKGYRQTRSPDALEPIGSTAPADKKSRADGRGKGLDLIA